MPFCFFFLVFLFFFSFIKDHLCSFSFLLFSVLFTLRLTSLGRGRAECAAAEGLWVHKKGGSLGKASYLLVLDLCPWVGVK